jgi:hypothetical protein
MIVEGSTAGDCAQANEANNSRPKKVFIWTWYTMAPMAKSITLNVCGCGGCGACRIFRRYQRKEETARLRRKTRPLKPRKRGASAVSESLGRRLLDLPWQHRARLIRTLAGKRGVKPQAIYNWLKRHIPGWSIQLEGALEQEALKSKYGG